VIPERHHPCAASPTPGIHLAHAQSLTQPTIVQYAFIPRTNDHIQHVTLIPKTYRERLRHVPDEELSERLPTAKKLLIPVLAVENNILQNNMCGAHQLVYHVYVLW